MQSMWEVSTAKRPRVQDHFGQMPPIPALETSSAEQPPKPEAQPALDAFAEAGLKPSKVSGVLHSERLSYDRKAAIKKWMSVIKASPMEWLVAKQSYSDARLRFAQGGLVDAVKDALSSKATSTLHARASPMLRYIHFSTSECLEAFPVTEEKIYNYIKSLEGAAATYPRSFLISLSFSWHVLGLQGVSPVLFSGRIKGASDKHFAQRSKVRRRPALRASQVLELERLVHDPSQSNKDRIGAGFFLFLVYGRLRFSDAQNVTEMSPDEVAIRGSSEGFLECLASRTKTSISLERKIRALPIVVPMMCLGAAPWIPVWLDLRARNGLHLTGDPDDRCLLPCPARGEGWTQQPLTVGQGAAWLRSLLKDSPPPGAVPLGTHSCKTTLLSWASKRGLPHGPRRILEYHVSSPDNSLVIYSRDAVAAPLRLLCSMLKEVKANVFVPDATRSGMLLEAVDPSLPKTVASDAGAEASSSDSSQGSEDEEDSEASTVETALDAVAGHWGPAVSQDEPRYARHKQTRFLHKIADETGHRLKCGRPITTRMNVLAVRPQFLHPVCTTCFTDL